MIKTLEEAKIASSSLNPLTQILKFTVNEPDYLCLELNKELLETLESGQRYKTHKMFKKYYELQMKLFHYSLVIRGDPDDHAVLCTENKTYDLKDTETSNSMLIMKSLKFPKDVKHLQDSSNVDRTVEIQIVNFLIYF